MVKYDVELEQLKDQIQPEILLTLHKLGDFLKENGYGYKEPQDMSGDDYIWNMLVWRNGSEYNKIAISIKIAEEKQHDNEDGNGINFKLDIEDECGILGELCPFNYTKDCWVDLFDNDAIIFRLDEFLGWVHDFDSLLSCIEDK